MWLKQGKTGSSVYTNLMRVCTIQGNFPLKLSVFHQFNGRFGPTAISVSSEGYILTSLFEFNNIAENGCIGILNKEGELR